MDYETDQRAYDDEPRGYDERERSRSPRPGNSEHRARSASPNGRMDTRPPPPSGPPPEDDEDSRNPGSNLFVTGIHPRLSEGDVTALFEKYGEVVKCNIMRDPHSKESRGFGFVNMGSIDAADAAKEGLQGEVHEGRTLSIERARRSKPRTPTPGRYFGPPKNDFRGPPRGGSRYGDRYDDRRYGGGYGGRRDDYSYRGSGSYRYSGGGGGGGSSSRYDDRGYGGRRDRYYDDRPPVDRYASRDDRYGGGRGGGGNGGRDYFDREPSRRGGPAPYGDAPPPRDYPAKEYGGSRYDEPADDRFARR